MFKLKLSIAAANSVVESEWISRNFSCTKRSYDKKTSLTSGSAEYVEGLYKLWKDDPSSVHPTWDKYFKNLEADVEEKSSQQKSETISEVNVNDLLHQIGKKVVSRDADPAESSSTVQASAAAPAAAVSAAPASAAAAPCSAAAPPPPTSPADIKAHLAVAELIRSYQSRGYIVANLDPLNITNSITKTNSPPDGVQSFKALRGEYMDKSFELNKKTFIGGSQKSLPLKEIIKRLKFVYCRHCGIEFMHNKNIRQCQWIRKTFETPGAFKLSNEDRKLMLRRVIRSCDFEGFLAKTWPSVKRFGGEGTDLVIPVTQFLMDRSTELGCDTFVIGMPHRGRLNILANVCHKPLKQIFTQFYGLQPADLGAGDIKYHLGTLVEFLNKHTNKNMKVSVIANPSHLETVAPIAVGRVYSEQFYRGDTKGKQAMAIIYHGDAAFCGQGVCYETIHLSDLPCYSTKGVIHIVSNNQIGFTTEPRYSRSSPFCTDVGKIINAPIFHVNAEHPDSGLKIARAAAEYRAKFGRDVIIDVVGYRKHGHNELDVPKLTSPYMYNKIEKKRPVSDIYSEKLIKEGVVTESEVKKIKDEYFQYCQREYEESKKETHIRFRDWLDTPWAGYFEGKDPLKLSPTGIKEEMLQHIGKVFSSPPPAELNFELHDTIKKILKRRKELVSKKQADWALGEAFAFASLLKEGIHIRLSGEDAQRSTFGFRHHVMHHQTKDKVTYNPILKMYPDQAPYTVCNSSLSEYGVLGFDLGYSMTNPNCLVLWEAQFGDFHDTGQPVVDQYLCAGELKWLRQCGMVMLLPHGLDGGGPEHSSAKIERFLGMCADDPEVVPEITSDLAVKQLHQCNWIIANCTTPANYFHILRRQMTMHFRKPLVMFTPKSLLRHKLMVSNFSEMTEGTEFQRVLGDPGPAGKNPAGVKKVFFCSGKVHAMLYDEREKRNAADKAAIVRVEQLYPFPYDLMKREADKYSSAKLFWAQEEYKNLGPWEFVRIRMENLLAGQRPFNYVGRPTSCVPAVGSPLLHKKEIRTFLDAAFKDV